MNINNNCEIELLLFFLRESADRQPYSRLEQIKLLKEISNKSLELKEAKKIVDSGRTVITISGQKFKEIIEKLELVGIHYSIVRITERSESKLEKDFTQEINFIVSRDILKKKKNEIVECIVISREEYNELLKCKEMAQDLISSLRPITKNLSALTKDFSIALHNHIS